MPMELVLLPRDGGQIHTPFTASEHDALYEVAARFGGGRENDGASYDMKFSDGGDGRLSCASDTRYGVLTVRNWDAARAECTFQLMQATDRVLVLANTNPLVVLTTRGDVALHDMLDEGPCEVRIVASSHSLHDAVERAFENWEDYREQVVAQSGGSR